jgi:sterol regulatory element-binding transcription factor 1
LSFVFTRDCFDFKFFFFFFVDSSDSFLSWGGVATSLFVWMANIVLLISCLVKLLIFGDPVLVTKSKASIEYWKHKKQSNTDFERVSYAGSLVRTHFFNFPPLQGNQHASFQQLKRCLQCFGLQLPATRFECLTSTSWQFIRMFLHRIWIGRWLSRKAGGGFFSGNSPKRMEALSSAKEIALVYHRLNQLHLTMNMSEPYGLMLSLYAVNAAEAASDLMLPEDMIEIYITAAMRVKHTYPKFFQYFCRYYLGKAKQVATGANNLSNMPAKYQWAFSHFGYRFLIGRQFKFEDATATPTSTNTSLFSVLGNKADPLAYVIREYRESLLKKAIQCLVGSGCSSGSGVAKTPAAHPPSKPDPNSGKDSDSQSETAVAPTGVKNGGGHSGQLVSGSQISDVLIFTELLKETMAYERPSSFNLDVVSTENCYKDRLIEWWSSLLSVAAYWLLGEDGEAEKLYSIVEKVPLELHERDDTLPKALLAAFNAKKLLV